MSKAKAASSTTRKAKSPRDGSDAAVVAAYRKFEIAHAAMRAANTPTAKAGDLGKGVKEKNAFKKWNRCADNAYRAAALVVTCPSSTLSGMLLKIKAVGFSLDHGPEYAKGEFAGKLEALENWTPSRFDADDEAIALILSLRRDIRRIIGSEVAL
jgi:hypothetical protein